MNVLSFGAHCCMINSYFLFNSHFPESRIVFVLSHLPLVCK